MGNSHSQEKQYPKLEERKYSSVDSRSSYDKDPVRSSKHSNDGDGKGKKQGVYMDPSKLCFDF